MSNRRLRIGLLLALAMAWASCRPDAGDDPGARAELRLEPSPPSVGMSTVTLTLTAGTGEPLAGAAVHLEGNMNHAGMKPSFADLEETAPGRYVGELDLTMGGDWFVIVTASWPDGRRFWRRIDVPGVEAR